MPGYYHLVCPGFVGVTPGIRPYARCQRTGVRKRAGWLDGFALDKNPPDRSRVRSGARAGSPAMRPRARPGTREPYMQRISCILHACRRSRPPRYGNHSSDARSADPREVRTTPPSGRRPADGWKGCLSSSPAARRAPRFCWPRCVHTY